MSLETGLVLSVALPGFMLLYAAFNLGRENDETRVSVLRMFYFGAAHVFLIGVPFVGGQLSRASSTYAMGDLLNKFMYAGIVVFMVFVFYLIIIYARNSMMAAAGQEEYKEL